MSFSGSEVTEKGFARGWDPDAQDQEQQRLFRMAQILEAALFRPFAWRPHESLGLRYAYYGGWVDSGSGWLFAPDNSLLLQDNSLNFVERSSAGVVASNTAGFTPAFIPMATVRTANGTVLPRTYVDCRPFQGSAGGGGGGAVTSFEQLVGVILASQVPLSVVQQHQGSLAINFTQLVGQIANGQVPVGAVTQHQAALSILFTQLVGQIADAQVPASAVLQHLQEQLALLDWLVALATQPPPEPVNVLGELTEQLETLDWLVARAVELRPRRPPLQVYASENFS
jgi:hypothetical protein